MDWSGSVSSGVEREIVGVEQVGTGMGASWIWS